MVAPDVIRAVGEQAFETFREVRAAARGIPDELASRVATGFVARQLDTAALVTEVGAQRVADGSRKLGSRVVAVRSGGRAAGGRMVGQRPRVGRGSRYVGESTGGPSARASVIMRWS
jgi:hypothetical protein